MDERTVSIAGRFLALAGVVFVVAAMLIGLAGWRGGKGIARRLWTAYLTEFGILGGVIVPAYFGTGALFAAVAAICALATAELYRVLGHAEGPWGASIGVLGGLAVVASAAFGTEALMLQVLVIGASITLAIGLAARTGPVPGVYSGARAVVGLVYPSTFGAYLLLLGRAQSGFGLIAFLIGVIELNDSAAMLGGLLIGGPKIWPRLSPKKTIAGSGLGLCAAVGGAAALGFAVPMLALPQVLGGGLLIGIAGQTGDLVASAIKRTAGVKNFAALVPDQGGILDIYDALIFTAPWFWLYLRAIGAV
jgi:phosphatidate cytidylyltransferase